MTTAPTFVSSPQPDPTPNDNPSCHDLVIADMEERKAFGLRKYNSLLQPENGRDMLVDAYQEVLDLAVYLRGAIFERDKRSADEINKRYTDALDTK